MFRRHIVSHIRVMHKEGCSMITTYQVTRCHNLENQRIIVIMRVDFRARPSSILKSRHNNLLNHTEERPVISCVDVRVIMCVPPWSMNPHTLQMLRPDSEYLISAEKFFFFLPDTNVRQIDFSYVFSLDVHLLKIRICYCK